jgi:hypothetical protein
VAASCVTPSSAEAADNTAGDLQQRHGKRECQQGDSKQRRTQSALRHARRRGDCVAQAQQRRGSVAPRPRRRGRRGRRRRWRSGALRRCSRHRWSRLRRRRVVQRSRVALELRRPAHDAARETKER